MSKSNRCEACGAELDRAAHAADCPAQKVTITDKRGSKKDQDAFNEGAAEARGQMPTAQELLDADGQVDGEDTRTEFERQRLEEEKRLADWEAMSDDEKQEILARQAAENEGTPYAGSGMQNSGEMRKGVMTAFLIVVDFDGTALATDNLEMIENLDLDRSATPPDMYRACAEIMGDISAGNTAMQVMRMMAQQANAMQEEMRAKQMAQQLAARGVVPPGGRRR